MRRVWLLLAAGLLASCGQESNVAVSQGDGPSTTATGEASDEADPPSEPATEDPGERGGGMVRPPDVVVDGGAKELSLQPWTFCYRNGCADGFPPDPLPDIGSSPEVEVRFPLDSWDFSATFEAGGSDCARSQTVELERTGDTTAVLEPAGRAGTYDVTLFGRGRKEVGGGDLFVSFRWTTPSAGPMPEPEARLALLADHDGVVDSYGLELAISNLAASPTSSSATITVTGGNGRSLLIEPTLAPSAPCGSTEGSLYWDGPDDKGIEAAALGPAPFRYDVVLVLDGVRHVAEARWPADMIVGNEPSVALEFEPALPALRR